MTQTSERFVRSHTDQIQALNDAFRTTLTGGLVVLTPAVMALGQDYHQKLFGQLQTYDDFDADNDPYGEHDFGLIELDGHDILFKIDYYDLDMAYHSPDPSNPAVTCRVMTIMLAEDY